MAGDPKRPGQVTVDELMGSFRGNASYPPLDAEVSDYHVRLQVVDVFCSQGFGGTNHALGLGGGSGTLCGLRLAVEDLLEWTLPRRPWSEVTCPTCRRVLDDELTKHVADRLRRDDRD